MRVVTSFRVSLALVCLVLLPSLSTATVVTYQHDDGIISGGISVPGYKYATRFVISNHSGQVLGNIQVKQPEDPDPAGVCDVGLWAADGPDGFPGTLLASIDDVNVPQGTGWTTVDFSAQKIPLPAGAVVYAGIVCDSLYAYFDGTEGLFSYRQPPTGPWNLWGSGYLMVRMAVIVSPRPSTPTGLTVTPGNATLGDSLKATGSGSTSPDPNATVTYQYQWAKAPAGGTFGAFSLWGRYVPTNNLKVGDRWKARARAQVPGYNSAWVESTPVTIKKVIVSSVPAPGKTNVQRRAPIDLTFSWPVKQASVPPCLSVKTGAGVAVTGKLIWTKPNLSLRFTPDKPLAAATSYKVTVAKGVVRRDAGAIKSDSSFTFKTGSMPVVTSNSPTGNTVALTAPLKVYFDRAINPASVNTTTFKLFPARAGTFTVTNKLVQFTPAKNLAASTTYTVFLTADIASSTGVKLGVPFQWKFTTRAAAAPAALAATASARETTGGATAITVNLTSAATVSARIVNLAGRSVATLPARFMQEGVGTLLWSGRADSGTKVPPGRYFVKIEASTEEGAKVHCQAAIMK